METAPRQLAPIAALPVRTHPWHRRRAVWVIALLAAALVVAVGTAIDLSRRAAQPSPPLVMVAPVTRGLVTASALTSGVLEPIQATVITQPVAGRLIQVKVRAGERVSRGQILARFDSLALQSDLVRAEARVVAAEVAAFEAEMNLTRLDRSLPLDGREALEQQEEDMADAEQIMSARAAGAAAEVAAREAAYRLARERLSRRVVRAPSDGFVLSRHVDEGQMVAEGSSLFRLTGDPTALQINASVPEASMAAVKLGQEVRFSVPAFPGRTFNGRVAMLQPLTGPETDRRLPVVVRLESPGGDLRPGMTAKVSIQTTSNPAVVRVPTAALLFAPRGMTASFEQPAVWLTTAGSPRLERMPVTLGVTDGAFAEITAQGVAEGAAVAVGYATVK
jgi:HlyD family secretion protein